ncbi:unnamed protein product [Cuscuta europaea]|uniref:Uncharacterized protein n=1 Tax=Cuscuta europaea TaxID=41803 RepID=A0A9P1EKA3_CUSEU|nr:unnamed protein product [Cuscuta europaea]
MMCSHSAPLPRLNYRVHKKSHPLKPARSYSGTKILLTPQPCLKISFFSFLKSSQALLSLNTLKETCASAGVAKYGKPIGQDENIRVYIIVIGSVVVDPITCAQLGKGEVRAGFLFGLTFCT